MLPAAARLRHREDFAAVIRRGRRAGKGGVVVHLLPASAPDDRAVAPARVGLVVGKAVGNSVVRHRVSRQLRHLMRDRLDGLATGSRLVIRAQPSAAGRASALLGDDLDRALLRAGAPR